MTARIDPPCDAASVARAKAAQEQERASIEAQTGIVIDRTTGEITREAVPRLHSGPCTEALRDEEDTDDPEQVTCPHCLERRASVKPLTWAQQRRRGIVS